MNYELGSYGVLDRDNLSGNSLQILDGGIERRYREKYDFRNDNRPGYRGYLFQCTLKGEGCFEKDGKKNLLTTGQGFLARIPQHSRYYLEKESSDWEFAYLHFDGDAITPFYEKILELSGDCFQLPENSRAMELLIKLQTRMLQGASLRKYEGGKLLYDFICLLTEEIECPDTLENSTVNMVENAIQIMETEYGTLTGILELSDRMGVSLEHFSREFRKKTGTTPIKYLTEIRIQAAMNRLLNTADTVAEIAAQIGFANGNYFDKVFRKKLGVTPKGYRRQHSVNF
ncbi:MAG: helix-turn-helix domain-containing protein [Roseburia sp.]